MARAAGPRQVRLWVQGGQAHLGAVAADRVPPDVQPVLGQQVNQLARPQARALGVPLVQAVLDAQFLPPCGPRLVVQAAARDGQQFGLQHQRDRRAFFTSDERQPRVRRQARGQIFFSQFIFSQFTCVVRRPICS